MRAIMGKSSASYNLGYVEIFLNGLDYRLIPTVDPTTIARLRYPLRTRRTYINAACVARTARQK